MKTLTLVRARVYSLVSLALVTWLVTSILAPDLAVADPNSEVTGAQVGDINVDTPLIVVFDTSGSMADPDSTGEVKIATAKQVMSTVLADGRMKTALWTFPGGVSQDGCEAGAWVKGSAWRDNADATRVNADIRSLIPSGNTPTGPALRAIAKEVGPESEAEIILVSDGVSNCGEDPCSVAKELIAAGYRLRVQPIGFDLADDGANELSCIADATGGTYREAPNAEELREYIEQTRVDALNLEVSAPSIASTDSVLTVTAKVTNNLPTREITGTKVNLIITDNPSLVGRFQALQKPLPRIRPGESTKISWKLSLTDKPGSIDWKITAGASNVEGQIRTGSIEIKDGLTQLEDAGEILKNIPGEVALMGDSYSSGEGAGGDYDPPAPGIDAACHRKTDSVYPTFIFGESKVVRNFACSGAKVNDMLNRATLRRIKPDVPLPKNDKSTMESQISQLSQAVAKTHIGAVFLTVGGNDVGFGEVVRDCVNPFSNCNIKRDKEGNIETTPLTQAFSSLPNLFHPPSRGSQVSKNPADYGLLPEVYSKINQTLNRKRAPGTQSPIFVSAYPMPVHKANRGKCDLLDAGEVAVVWNFLESLNLTIAAAVNFSRENYQIPVYFVPPIADMAQPDHTICGKNEDSFFVKVTGLDTTRRITKDAVWKTLTVPELAHPNTRGHKKWANDLIAWSTEQNLVGTNTGSAPNESLIERLLRYALPPRDVELSALAQPADTPRAGLSKNQKHVTAGAKLYFSASGIAPNSPVYWLVNSTPIFLGDGVADETGKVELQEFLPTSLPLGVHRVEVWGWNTDGERAVASAEIRLVNATPVWVLAAASVAAVGAILTLASFLVAWRRRANHRKALHT